MIKIITCAGYYGTGSSIITDLLKEFDNCYSMGNYEFRFIQDPDGISDLEYNLVENNHRHNSGNALKKYEKLVKFLSGNKFIKKYEKYFNNEFYKESQTYINNLKILEWNGMWHEDVRNRGVLFYYIERTINKIVYTLNCKLLNKESCGYTFLKKEKTYLTNPKENFYKYTKEYLDNLFKIANKEDKEYIVVDQLVPPTNLERYLQYFNNLKIVVVDRDPRDCYILEKLYWKGTIIPTKNVEEFIIWYKEVRNHKKNENENTIYIKFEEAIYNYDVFLKKILKFLNIKEEEHVLKYKFFNPEISINNTKLWLKHPELNNDIEIIEQNLGEYCYKY